MDLSAGWEIMVQNAEWLVFLSVFGGQMEVHDYSCQPFCDALSLPWGQHPTNVILDFILNYED